MPSWLNVPYGSDRRLSYTVPKTEQSLLRPLISPSLSIEATHPIGTRARLAFGLLLYTARARALRSLIDAQ